MPMVKKFLVSLSFLLLVLVSGAQQTKEEIQKKQAQLQKELADLNNTLNQIKSSKKQSLGQLALVQRKIEARQQLISTIDKDVRRLNNEIYSNAVQINKLKKELDTLRQNYARSLVFAYKNRSNYDYLNFIFSAKTFNDAIKRVAYLRSYRQYRETQADAIVQTENLLEKRVNQLTSSKQQKNVALKDESAQLGSLEKDKKEKDGVVQQLKGKEKDIAAQIKINERNRVKLQSALQTIIKREIDAAKKKAAEQERQAKIKAEAERKKQEAANALAKANANAGTTNSTVAEEKPEAKPEATVAAPVVSPARKERTYSALESTNESLTQSINFETNRGNLPWPVSSGYVSTQFGRYNVPGTGLTGDMPGVEISMPAGSVVKAVADGEVSAVFDMGDGQAIVIRHGKYFTTYSHLGSVAVSRGQKVNAGTQLGRAAQSLDGDGQIIFMVTNEKNVNLNPESWLKGR